MRIQIEPSEILTHIDGVPVRVWNGITDSGTQCFVFVATIGVRTGGDCDEFEQALHEVPIVLEGVQ